MSRYLVPVFVTTVFLSAFLLFVFQPMVGKYLLPLLGGTPSVWNTAMLFFQILLLAGYIYAHLIGKIRRPLHQAGLHIILMAVAGLSLPLALPSENPSGGNPVLWQLQTMTGMAAAPFFILSASAPLLQKWFSLTTHPNAENPYFLYSASNIGSMLALVSYPFVTEPLLGLHQQSIAWAAGYGALALLFIVCVTCARMKITAGAEIYSVPPVSWPRRLTWVFLAFCPSSLMLGYTSYVTTDVASVPLFWIAPLALYLGTFIIAFSRRPVFPLVVTRIIYGFALLIMLFLLMVNVDFTMPWAVLAFHGVFFFFAALLCHQELVALRPGAARLTEFYLFMSLGGALGGVFNSLIAPVLFKLPVEYYIVMILSTFALYASDPVKNIKKRLGDYKWHEFALFPGLMIAGAALALLDDKKFIVAGALAIFFLSFGLLNKRIPLLLTASIIAIFNSPYSWSKMRDAVLIERNFFGVLRIQDYDAIGVRILSNGTTSHGAQALDHNFEKIPLTYYYPAGPVGDIFAELDGVKGDQKVAALGLGVGSIACYGYPGRSFNFYEINPAVVRITEDTEYFSFLKNCGSPYKIILGDARHEIAAAPDGNYDLIFVDVFSSDNIPIHVMTLEAMRTYREKLKPGGMIVVHISNRFFNLEREVAALGRETGLITMMKYHKGGPVYGTQIKYHPSIYTVLTDNEAVLKNFGKRGWLKLEDENGLQPWTDDYANIIRAFK